jgi:endoglucanase
MKKIGLILCVAGMMIFIVVAHENGARNRAPMVFSSRTMLLGLWDEYKEQFLERTGRTLDPQRDNITTSEGQSYTMLRAVWVDDQETFDSTWQWTRENMQRSDLLFSWLYGEKPDGTMGVLVAQGGENSAADADTDIAVALLFAYNRWRDGRYLDEARGIVQNIWEQEVVMAGGEPVLASNNIEQFSDTKILVNPSYFAPYAYRMFAHVDPDHDWDALIASSYRIIRESASSRLDKEDTSSLPPDWIFVNRKTGTIEPATVAHLTTGYGYEAARLPFRLALDWKWYGEPRAAESLSLFGFLKKEWREDNAIYATYAHDGQVTGDYEAPVMYGGSMGYFVVTEPGMAREIYEKKLSILYNSGNMSWRTPLSYYDTNWAWFGLALYHDMLVNLSPFPESVSSEAQLSSSS